MFIRTERLFLRPGWIEDAPELARAIAHEPAVRMLAHALSPNCEADARAFLQAPQDPRLPSLLVTSPAERGRIVGTCALDRRETNDVEIGFWITPERRCNGYAQEALAGLLRVAPVLGHNRIVARQAADNPAWGRVLRANGFRPRGRIGRDRNLGRGEGVATVEYAWELAANCSRDADWTRLEAYAAGEGLGAAA